MNPAASTTRTYHVWFSTKGRKSVLFEEIRDAVLQSMRRVASAGNIDILAVEATWDHVHLLVNLKPDQRLPIVMHDLKGTSAREVLMQFPQLRLDMHANSLWQKSYGYRFVPADQVSQVVHYIQTQNERPLRHQ